MSAAEDSETEKLLRRIAEGDRAARGLLLASYRQRLKQMVALRLDSRLAARIDPSDVVQETLAEADQKLDAYARDRPLPFYLWLRRLGWERVILLHRRHIRTQKRSVRRETPGGWSLPDKSALQLAQRLAGGSSSPSDHLQREERSARVRQALAELNETDREVLVLRFLEDLAPREVGAVLGISEAAVKMRQLRAIQRMRGLLGESVEDT
jgi:RNA polymerase sigma-70 factor, ECF subfamily